MVPVSGASKRFSYINNRASAKKPQAIPELEVKEMKRPVIGRQQTFVDDEGEAELLEDSESEADIAEEDITTVIRLQIDKEDQGENALVDDEVTLTAGKHTTAPPHTACNTTHTHTHTRCCATVANAAGALLKQPKESDVIYCPPLAWAEIMTMSLVLRW